MSLGTLTVDLVMKTGKFETDTKRAERRAKDMAKNIDASISKVGNMIGVGLVAAAGAAVVALQSTVQYVDELATSAEQLGVSFKAFQELQFAAVQSDVEISKLTTSFAKLSEKVGSLGTEGGKAFAETLKTIGVNAEELVALAPDKQFEKIIGALSKIENVNARAAASNDIFGKSFKDLNPLINQGEDGLRALREEANATGAVISDQARNALTDFDNAMNRLTLTTKAAMAEAFTPLAVFLTGQMDGAISGTRSLVGLLGEELLGLTVNIQKALSGFEFYKDVYTQWRNSDLFGPGLISFVEDARDRERERDKNIDRAAEYAKQGGSKTGNGNGRGRGVQVDVRGKVAAMPTVQSAKTATASASKVMAAADREAEDAARRLADASADLNSILSSQSAEIGGPLVRAAQDYSETMVKLLGVEQEMTRQGKLDAETQASINLAKEQALRLYQETTEAIQNQKTPAQEELERLRNELELLGLTNEERAKRVFLLNNPGASEADAEQAAGLVRAIDQAAKAQQAMDQFRSSAEDAFAGFLTGSMSAKDAFESFADSVVQQIARILAQQAIESLFGGFGGAGGGTFGGSIGSFFGSLFGGGRASGGAVQGNRLYRVNENGPEMLSYQGKDFLMMGGGAGMVRPNGGGSNITVNVSPMTERRTALQIASRVAEKQRLASTRNG
jgi:hypothetical protein